ncbi:MAG: peptide ABC transporter substrate-binding protein [Jiangellaceae bacterium]
MRVSTRKASFAVVTALALGLSACGGDEEGDGAGGGDDELTTGGSFSIYIGEPENPLVPGQTNESEGGQVVDSLWTGLIQYNNETNEAEFTGVAESVESEDQTTWTITLNEGWTFHDGTDVTAQSYVDTWNWVAYSPNANDNSYFFANVEGYDDLQAPTDDAGEPTGEEPAATEMSGLEVVDERTFTVTLSSPFAQYPVTVGYTAFFPLPEAFFENPDPAAFGEQPIGNGPFMAEEPFVPGQGITLTRYEDYSGDEPANADEVEYRVYTEQTTAYSDVQAGNLDVVDQIPPDAIASAPDEFGDQYQEAPRGDITSLNMPTYDPRYSDPRVRHAFSMAIDRQAITDAIFLGSRQPATSYISPVVDGFREDACAGYCQLNVEEANALLDEAGFDRSVPVELWFNAGAGHDEWVQAVGNQLRENIGVEYVIRGDLQFAEYLPLIDNQGMTGPFRLGWIMDYPSPQNFLEPLYTEAALPPGGSNSSFYVNEEFDALIAEGNQAADNEEAIELYQQAEDILVEDMPTIPMFYGRLQYVHSENVDNVTVNAYGRVDAAAVTVVNP